MILSVLCILGFLGCFLNTISVFSLVPNHSRWYTIYFTFATVFTVFCLYELWMMKKWAFWGFLIYALVDGFICWQMWDWNLKTLVFIPLILVTSLVYYRRLS